ncbi:alpha-mannosidase [Paenibacillus sp. HB172176]|uniref:alpha-mannosidase n=1 Tax=Paenibacillus sp. HB172176 TaxID=2493690 RepID=UPI001438DF35|nr:alpha-mannosidase [Paenibacillus sp. HB172176]
MFWIVEKMQERLKELEPLRYKRIIGLDEWLMEEDAGKANGVQRAPRLGGETYLSKDDRWKGRDRYVWLQRAVSVPSDWQGERVVGLFDFGRTGGGNNSAFESLLYVDGFPYQGVDTNHQEVFFPEDAAGKTLELTFRLWSGLEGGGKPSEQEHAFKRADLAVLDAFADDLYFTGIAALETAKLLEESHPAKQDLLTALDRAFLLVDWSHPGSESFYDSVEAAAVSLKDAISKQEKQHPVTVHALGHTHIDVAWLWRLQHTREKSARSFSTVLRLMEQFPEYVFLQTQPQLYAYIKKDYPQIYEGIKERIRENRWEAGGAMWLEADCNLTSGESLVRQILHGTQFFREEFGVECDYLWLPDVFGYSWALPQILRKSGIKTFMTTKISWNQYNRMPHDTFKWRGIDGTEILTHFITTPDMPDAHAPWYTYNGLIEPYSVKGIWDQYRNKDFNRDLLLSYGYGDGGGGVNRPMLEMRRRLNEMPGLPKIVPGRADDYFEKLHEAVDGTDRYVHTWDGELYLEYHRGTYTSQAYNKRMNRKLELLYREAEWLQSLRAAVEGGWSMYPAEQLRAGWEIILRNQFHDIIPGSSITEVYEDCRLEYEEAERIGMKACSEAEEWLIASAGLSSSPSTRHDKLALTNGRQSVAYTLFNSAGYVRDELIRIELEESEGLWLSAEGEPLEAQYRNGGWLVEVKAMPSMGAAVLTFEPGQQSIVSEERLSQERFHWNGETLSTPYYEIAFNEAGQMTRMFDKEAKREVLPQGECANVLQVFEDKPKNFEAWDIDLFYQEKMREVNALQCLELVENGKHRAVLRMAWTYGASTIEQQLIVYSASRRIDFVSKADWRERQQLLKAAFPVNVRATEAVYDIQFGNVRRPTHWNTSWDYARFETVGHQWADLSERNYGVSLLNDCKYGYDIKDHVMRLSLIKSSIFPDPVQDQGEHVFTYSLYPHVGDWAEANTAREAWSLNNPLHAAEGASGLAGQSLLKTDAIHIHIDAVKKAEQGNALVVRLHDYMGVRGRVALSSDFRLMSWQECDLMERPIGKREEDAQELAFELAPYEIKTFLLEL